jgi:hypothetical protein
MARKTRWTHKIDPRSILCDYRYGEHGLVLTIGRNRAIIVKNLAVAKQCQHKCRVYAPGGTLMLHASRRFYTT